MVRDTEEIHRSVSEKDLEGEEEGERQVFTGRNSLQGRDKRGMATEKKVHRHDDQLQSCVPPGRKPGNRYGQTASTDT